MILIIDNYDSFVYNIAQYISEFEKDIHIFRNDKITIPEIEKLNPDAIILSPGPKRPEDSKISLDIIEHFHDKKPILGICLGHQAIGHIFNARVTHAKTLVHGKKTMIKHTDDVIFKNIPNEFSAGRYHSLAVSENNFPHDILDIIATNITDNEIMGVKLKKYPVYGLQFHPESILTEHGKLILSNFYNFVIPKKKKINIADIAIKKLSLKENLSEEEAEDMMNEIMTGLVGPVQIAAILMGLKIKGETTEELVGSIKKIKQLMNKVELKLHNVIDTCGTGGDSFNTFNISTASAIVCAGAGVYVAKHGNRSVSSKSGSADIFQAFGVKIDADKKKIIQCIEQAGIGFLFAPLYHPAFKNVGSVRKELKLRTIFNMIGPTVNPANVKRQVLGIFSPELTEKFAGILQRTGVEKALVFSSAESMDEISTFSKTRISYLNKDEIRTFVFDPERCGLKTGRIEDIQVSKIEESKSMIEDILNNKSSNETAFNSVLLNSAAGIFVAGKDTDFSKSFPKCIEKARETMNSKKPLDALNKMIRISNS
ncbi:MAG: anthranilate phosphoribosyltransferase [Spirochaetes bacterium]|nr:anthranilate phosphoribosyltransferase [Spirochaetota bacterium]